MKNFFRSTLQKLRRMMCSVGFWIAILLIVIITITSDAYTDLDGAKYSMLTILFHFDEAARVQNGIDVQNLFMWINVTFSMYGMLFAALSYASVLCEEQKYGVRRYLLFKEGKWIHTLSNACASVMSSGLVFLVGTGIIMVFLYCNYPLRSETDQWGFEAWLSYRAQGAPWLYEVFGEVASFIQLLSGVFLYGIFCGFIGFACAAFFSNMYLLTCIPFFFGYFYFSVTQSIYARVGEGSLPMEVMNVLHAYASPECYMGYWNYRDSFWANMALLAIIWGLSIGLHMLSLNKKADCGGIS